MQLRILGCSGGIGGTNRTTSMLLGERTLIDAGTGVGDLTVDEMARIDQVFLTHAHLDHIACLPMMLDNVLGLRDRPVTVHANRATLQVLRDHVFNWAIWPDFSAIPSPEAAMLRFAAMEIGETREVDGCRITALPVLHTVPAVAYAFDSGAATLVFSGDTTDSPEFWRALNAIDNLRTLIVETAFADREEGLARLSKHFSPRLLVGALAQLARPEAVEVLITHLKPADHALTMREVLEQGAGYRIARLEQGQVIQF
ncbi:cAMP phosphodiesterase class-II:metallo-beta-lactamase superfamily protein [Chitiniphilus shinanonensis]|uniref:cAMP phosphodiesterase class-II:metallo-beta-lactamase superfamily protein n=1 Tax=Chitiniphilus shinanonensis TaxID=553088 RepID=A0ABQ6BYW8_9NEIS|nr:3',5'-cyclic-nucleotide phosphodiesterase [Chitiniphilus shinanonensis]GLS05088.1 cAMP phosphodiesterase class-II:metallo-beta-lactamase superfamily protein [Chitiniphilus shinanonensis]